MEEHAAEWLKKAKVQTITGNIHDDVSNTLFDHTWQASITQIAENLHIQPGMKLMEAGSGWGRLIHGLKYYHPEIEIDGYELTPELVAMAKEILTRDKLEEGVTIIRGDLLEIEIPANHYDALYSARVVHYIDDKRTVIRKFYDVLKPGGVAMIILPNSWCPYRWFTYTKIAPLYPIRDVGAIMRSVGFKKLKYSGFGFIPTVRRYNHKSYVCAVERALASTPLCHLAGLAYVTAVK